tara:strand:- start:4741 stop:5004 length:264 start_codon:yes stop_codon:yes gene_type:complete
MQNPSQKHPNSKHGYWVKDFLIALLVLSLMMSRNFSKDGLGVKPHETGSSRERDWRKPKDGEEAEMGTNPTRLRWMLSKPYGHSAAK